MNPLRLLSQEKHMVCEQMKHASLLALLLLTGTSAAFADNSRLPDGTEFPVWEKPLHFTKTYYVDANARNATDSGPGTKEHPFRTIDHAAQVLQPSEQVIIASGVYREAIRPARGGTSPDAMISYEAAPGADVVVSGAVVTAGWQPSEGWNIGPDRETNQPVKAYQLHLDPKMFPLGYNPFALDNVTDDRYWINYAKDNMWNYFRRRGLVFVDGKPLEQVESPSALAGLSPRSLSFFSDIRWTPLFQEFSPYAGKVWVESDGLTLHIRLANDDDPAKHVIEITNEESVFSPAKPYQSYIRVKGIKFRYAGNSYPNPQRGLVSTNHGNHFIFEDNSFEWANSVGLDIGDVDWAAARPPQPVGFDVIRHNVFRYCGIEGLGGTGGPQNVLVEKNLFEWIGWQDAARMSESGGTKMHRTRNLLFRNNVVRHIRHANGIWLDIGNTNDRLTGNVFADIPGDVNPHAIHIEGSDALNEIDNNIFDHLTGGVLIRDTNHVIIAYNLFVDCAKVCIDTASGLGAPRPINGHTNDVHDLRVFGNVFSGIGQSAIEFNNPRNTADGNVYGFAPGRRAGMQPYLRVKFPDPPEWDNLESWRDQHDWDKTGTTAEVAATFNPDALEMSVAVKGDVKALPVYGGIDVDFYGHPITETNRMPGPFADLTATAGSRTIDPR
ncbi:right-handed parallel beta-helix repeat-containing protein [Terriglobus albidus]|uniref:right-handed parallel beta-helix repeat-containing protein n=1 Tax=Terriglobus albidus TaxID=1592106 RepID=UPI0021DF42C6|nr:right-handed parallel beta-helix repeat-containing protein [Terriglobus albidus]